MPREALPRLDTHPELHERLLSLCRLAPGEVWEDSVAGHRVGVLDATRPEDVARLMNGEHVPLMVHDPPYNVAAGGASTPNLFAGGLQGYMAFSEAWVTAALQWLADDAHFYVWLGADQNRGFQPLPDFMLMMRKFESLRTRSFITMRNQRGYGTRRNWMAVRQELLYYVRGEPAFDVVYTDIPKILRGYYKEVSGQRTENLERSRARTIRPGNVWVDVQQVFYRREENAPGAYAQKPLKALERIISACSGEGDLLADFFAHSGTTLLAAERLGRRCFCMDLDPVFAELTIRRLEHFRETGETGWQWRNPFEELE